MGVLETLLLLTGLGGAMYFGVYYLIPAMQQMAYAPLYYAQAQAQQQPPPAPAAPAPETPAPAPVPETTPVTETPVESTTDKIEDAVGDVLEDAGLVKDPPAEKKSSNEKESDRKSKSETDLKASNAEQKKKRAEYDAATDPKKDTRSKEELAKAQKAAGFYTSTEAYWGIVTKRRYRSINDL